MKRALLLSFVLAAPALAQDGPYRANQPPVLQGQTDTVAEARKAQQLALSDYQAAYRRAGAPKFLMMWHRELSDKISSAREIQAVQARSGPAPRNNFEQVITIRWKDGAERAVSLLAPEQNAEFETGFHQALRAGGTTLVDRNTAIRMTALAKARQGAREEDMNFQTVEASALADYAQYFIEVRLLPAASGRSEARVTVIGSRTGEILADVMSNDGAAPAVRPGTPAELGYIPQTPMTSAQPGAWTTDEHGFARRAAAPRTARDEGQATAQLVMRALADAWTSAAPAAH